MEVNKSTLRTVTMVAGNPADIPRTDCDVINRRRFDGSARPRFDRRQRDDLAHVEMTG